jgi:betaine-aldehyde dehydrogenase
MKLKIDNVGIHGSLFIDGQWAEGRGAQWTAHDPATEAAMAELCFADSADVHLAVAAARRAAPALAAAPASERAALLHRIAQGLRDQAAALARLETQDVGKPLREAEIDVADAARVFEYHAELLEAGALNDTQPALDSTDFTMRVRQVPLGAVALITAWNFPLILAAWKLAPALAAGNAVVMKPSEWACLSTLALAGTVHAAGAMPGQFNVLTGTGAEVGVPLVQHRDVNKVSFTGSGAVGRQILATSVGDLRRVTLELGGKSPAIVLADADLDAALEWVLMGIFYNAGQVCSATSRLLVKRSIHREFVDRLVARAKAIRVGAGLDPASEMGPVVSALQRDRVCAAIDQAVAHGARLRAGGSAHAKPSKGWFVQPTILDEVPADSAAWREEIFGPVLCVRPFDDDAQAVAEANDSDYGLAAAVFGRDAARTERLAAQLQAGTVWINCAGPALVQGPWGGFKASGIGRELGRWGIESYCQPQQITRSMGAAPAGWYAL